MANIKTAISLQKALFDQVDSLAREKKVSRSRLFVMALEDYLRRDRTANWRNNSPLSMGNPIRTKKPCSAR